MASMKESPVLASVLICAFYGVTSSILTLANKLCLTTYEFDYPNTLSLAQMATSLIFLTVLKSAAVIQFHDYSWRHAVACYPLAACYMLNIVTGLAGLSAVSIPIFSAIRRLTSLVVLAQEVYVLKKRTTRNAMSAVAMMCSGALLAGANDLYFDMWGYVLVFANSFTTASYLIVSAKISKAVDLDSFGLMFYNNLLSLFPMTIIVFVSGEGAELSTYTGYGNIGFQVSLLLSSVLAFVLNYSIFLCTIHNSPLATSITGNIKNIMTDALGIMCFRVAFTMCGAAGLIISMFGAFWYSYEKYQVASNKYGSDSQV